MTSSKKGGSPSSIELIEYDDEQKSRDEDEVESDLLNVEISPTTTQTTANTSTKIKYYKTAVLFFGYLSLGLDISVLGIVLPTLANNIRSSIEIASTVLVVRGFGFLFGSALSGLLDRKLRDSTIITLSLFIKSCGVLFIALPFGITCLFLFTALNAIGMGMLETIGNVHCIRMWGKKVDPFMQLLHFGFCLGSIFSPILAKPFINEPNPSGKNCNNLASNNLTPNFTLASNASSSSDEFCDVIMITDTSIPYVTIIYICLAIFSFFLTTMFSCSIRYDSTDVKNKDQSKSSRNSSITSQTKRNGILLLLFTFFFIYNGIEISFISFFYIFAVSPEPGMAYSKQTASDLCIVFFACVLIGQFASIFLSRKLSAKTIILMDVSGLLVATVIMVISPLYYDRGKWLFWVGVGVAGLHTASLYGTTFLWAEKYIHVDGRAASVFIVGGSLGEILLPIPIGQLITSNPYLFLVLLTGYVLLLAVNLAALFIVTSSREDGGSEVEPDEP